MMRFNDLVANQIYSILEEECGASKYGHDRFEFVVQMCDRDCTEFRFQGFLGFGGKLYRSYDKVYVGYYPEDETSDRKIAADKANKRIETLLEVSGVKPESAEEYRRRKNRQEDAERRLAEHARWLRDWVNPDWPPPSRDYGNNGDHAQM
jgi:hypothetical protein